MKKIYQQKKTILFTIDEYHYGGATTFIRQYSSVAHKLGYRTIILGFTGDMQNPEKEFQNSLICFVPQQIQWGILGRIKNIIYYALALKRLYYSYNIDQIHLSTTWSSFSAYCLLETWWKKRVITFYGLHDKEILSTKTEMSVIKKKTNSTFYQFMQFFVLWATPKIITFSKYAKTLIGSSFGVRINMKTIIIPGFISSMPKTHKLIRRKIPIRIINFGRAEPRKGIDILLSAIKKVNLRKIRYQATIASPTQYYRDYNILKAYEQLNLFTQVHFIHALNNEQKIKLLSESDVFILPSQDLETFGMTTIESLSCGVPVIGTNIGATPEILSKVDQRLLCKNTSSESIYKKLLWFYHLSINERQLLTRRALRAISQYYTEARHMDTIQSVYET